MSSRYWGEEKQADVHYAVYLKKVYYQNSPDHCQLKNADLFANCAAGKSRLNILRYNLLQALSEREPEDDRLEWESIRIRVIKAATLQKWVLDMVLMEDDCARGYLFELFFETYRAVAQPLQVLTIILNDLAVLLSGNKSSLRRSAQAQWKYQTWCTIIRRWLARYPEDFDDHPTYACLNRLIEFARQQGSLLDFLGEKACALRNQFARNAGAAAADQGESAGASRTLLHRLPDGALSCYMDLSHADPLFIAEQLTWRDAQLFQQLLCYQCQSCFWSRRRDRVQGTVGVGVDTVSPTVEQFNAVSRRVASSVVYNVHEKAYYRAKVVSTWILVAQELRLLKNFSSLKAVLAGLQSEPVHRLRSVWALIPNELMHCFQELADIFREQDNSAELRHLLMHEGTSKTAISGSRLRQNKPKKYRRTVSSDMLEVQGTVPYLGTFLTDLTMIDSAFPDFTPEGLINVDKRRREYEIIGQLKIIQKNARYYRIQEEPKFRLWFRSLPDLGEKLCYELSCTIEPAKESASPDCSGGNSQFYLDEGNGGSGSPMKAGGGSVFAPDRCGQLLAAVRRRDRSVFYQPLRDLDCLEADLGHLTMNGHETTSTSNSSNNTSANLETCYIVKVTLDKSLQPAAGNYETVYKCVKLENADRTRDLIRKALNKHGLSHGHGADQYSIAQILPGGKRLELPDRVNAFYAVSPCDQMVFVLRRKEILAGSEALRRSDSHNSGMASRWNSTALSIIDYRSQPQRGHYTQNVKPFRPHVSVNSTLSLYRSNVKYTPSYGYSAPRYGTPVRSYVHHLGVDDAVDLYKKGCMTSGALVKYWLTPTKLEARRRRELQDMLPLYRPTYESLRSRRTFSSRLTA